MNRLFFLALIVVLLLSACGQQGAGTELSRGNAAAITPSATPALDAATAAQYAALEQLGGVPGVDYDPAQITVSYLPGASTPAGLAAAPVDPAARAAAQANAILRQNKAYEPLTDAIAARYGLTIRYQVYWGELNFAAYTIPAGINGDTVLAELRREFLPAVACAAYSRLYHQALLPNDPDFKGSTSSNYGAQWGHRKINCDAAWDITTGDPDIMIAVVDTGVRVTHQELSANVLDPQVAFPGSRLDVYNNDNTVEDYDGHGTFIAGLIGSQVNNNRTLAGAAYNCKVMPVKITDANSASDAAIAYGCALAANLGAQVVNLSYGGPTDDPILSQMVSQVVNAGVLFIAAAGNEGTNTREYPGAYDKAMCVGATDINDARTDFSNYGTWVDIAAPGQYLKSTTPATDSSYNNWMDGSGSGTSFAAPLVAAAAGLIWSLKPNATVAEVREYLETTGASTSGFGSPVQRLDIAAALLAADTLRCRAPEPSRLIQHGDVTLTATVTVAVDSVSAYLDGDLIETKTAAPYNFTIDTSSITFGRASVTFIAKRGSESSADSVDLLVDNTEGVYPLVEGFESGGENFKGLDPKDYALGLLQSLKKYDGSGTGWTQLDLTSNGTGLWSLANSGGHSSTYCERMGSPSNSYGDYEIDTLVSSQVDLTNASSPTLTFYHHYNMQDGGSKKDCGYVMVTSDYGLNFSIAPLKAGGNALFSGYKADYTLAEVNLASFAGKKVHIVLVFGSDSSTAGEQSGAAGWWVDDLTVASGYATKLPIITGINLPANSVYGSVPGKTTLSLGVKGAQNIARVRYLVNVAPSTIGAEDILVPVNATPFTTVIDLSQHIVPNQLATVRVECWDSGNLKGPQFEVPLYLFNLAGDANADNMVDQADSDFIGTKLGLTNADVGYWPFCDSNFDRKITELDGAAVGYFWGASL